MDTSSRTTGRRRRFTATNSCGTIMIGTVATDGESNGEGQTSASTNNGFGCTHTVVWQQVDGWVDEIGNSRSIVGFESNSEFDVMTFRFRPAS